MPVCGSRDEGLDQKGYNKGDFIMPSVRRRTTLPVHQSLVSLQASRDDAIRYIYRHHDPQVNKVVVMFPGQSYPVYAPLFWYLGELALQAGYDVLGLEYGFQRMKHTLQSVDALVDEVGERLEAFFAQHPYRHVTVVAKSLGTVVASQLGGILESANPDAIYLTPLPRAIEAMQRATRMLVAVGDQDPLFRADDVRQIEYLAKLDLMLVPGADHALEIPGSIPQSIDILGKLMNRCREFLGR